MACRLSKVRATDKALSTALSVVEPLTDLFDKMARLWAKYDVTLSGPKGKLKEISINGNDQSPSLPISVCASSLQHVQIARATIARV